MPIRSPCRCMFALPILRAWAALLMLTLGVAATVQAQPSRQALKVGYLRAYSTLTLMHAADRGYFSAHGLDVELSVLNNGPAVAAAVQNGSLEAGFAAPVPIIAARSRGLNFRFFATTSYERPGEPVTVYLASKRAKVGSFNDLAGKTVAINAAGGSCELGVKDHLAAAGLGWRDIKVIIVPFPQMQAALELGSADVACTLDPFYASIMASRKIAAKVIALSPVAEFDRPIMSAGFFARDDWLQANAGKAAAFSAALEQAARDLEANPALIPKLLETVLRFAPDIAAAVHFVPVSRTAVDAASLQPLIDAMKRHGLIDVDVAAQDMQFDLSGEKR